MSRFFKSAAFPILIVIVLAFFAVKLINPARPNPRRPQLPDAGRRKELPNDEVKSVEIKNKGKDLEVKLNERRQERTKPATSKRPRPNCSASCKTAGVPYNIEAEKTSALLSLLTYILPFVLFFGFWIFLMNQVQGGGSKVMSFGKSRAKRMSADSPKITFRDVAGVDEAVEELHEIKEFLENPKKFQALGRADPDRRAALRAAGHRQDAARPRRRRRGGRAVLLDLRLGLRRDVRRRRRLARPRPVRAGQAEQPLHHLHGRDRRRRPSPRRRPRRRARRARADAQPAARRDGRLRGEGQHHHDRGHQPARHPRPGAAAPGPLRPPDRRRPSRPQGPREDPRGPHPRQAAGEGSSTSTRWPARRPASPAPTSRT